MPTRTATARYDGLGKEGQGYVSTQSGVLADRPYGFGTRFGDEKGTNPEELLAAAHAACFTMALAFGLAQGGHSTGTLETKGAVTVDPQDGGFAITRSALVLTGRVDGLDEADFRRFAEEAKAGCPLSKVLNCEITLDVRYG